MESVTGNAVKFVAVDLIADFIFFPVWWYTAGLVRALRVAGGWFIGARQRMAVGLWVKNLFVPMFAQYDLGGRLISFFVRLAMIVFRSLGLVILGLLILGFLMVWIIFPVVFVGLIVWQVVALLSV